MLHWEGGGPQYLNYYVVSYIFLTISRNKKKVRKRGTPPGLRYSKSQYKRKGSEGIKKEKKRGKKTPGAPVFSTSSSDSTCIYSAHTTIPPSPVPSAGGS